MSSREEVFSLPATIQKGIEERLKDLHTAMPGIIESFDPVNQIASVQPAIQRVFITREENKTILTPSNLPILINVPVQFPRGGGFSLTMPVKKGDECLLIFSERPIDDWHSSGQVKRPSARRFHHLSDATALVGISSVPNKIPNYDPNNMELKKDDGSVSIKWNSDGSMDITANSDINVNTPATANITAPTVNINGNTTIDGTLDVTGITTAPTVAATSSLTIKGKEMDGHIHSDGTYVAGSTDVTGQSGAPV